MALPDCIVTYVVPLPKQKIALPSGPDDIQHWRSSYSAADPEVTEYLFTVSAKAGKTVVLQGGRIDYIRHSMRPDSGTLVQFWLRDGCGFAMQTRYFRADLDSGGGLWQPGPDEKTNFPYAVKDGDPETFDLTAVARDCDCQWRIALDWSSGGEQGVRYISDSDGMPFHTMGYKNYPRLAWKYSTSSKSWAPTKFDSDYVPGI